jgi:hypothetical protein
VNVLATAGAANTNSTTSRSAAPKRIAAILLPAPQEVKHIDPERLRTA